MVRQMPAAKLFYSWAIMETFPNDLAENEPRLLRLYMDLTGSREPDARNVFMYVCSEKELQEESGRTEDGFWSSGEAILGWSFERHKNGRSKLDRLVHDLVSSATAQPAHVS